MGYNVHCVGIFGEFEKTRLGFGFWRIVSDEIGPKRGRTHNNRPFTEPVTEPIRQRQE